MKLLCTIFGIWCAAPLHPIKYEDRAHIVIPFESLGANWKVQNFRKKVLKPDNFDFASSRLLGALREYEGIGIPIEITFAPRWYRPKNPLNIEGDYKGEIWLNGLWINGGLNFK